MVPVSISLVAFLAHVRTSGLSAQRVVRASRAALPVMALYEEPTADKLRWADTDLVNKFGSAAARDELVNARAEDQRKKNLDDYERQKRGMLSDQLFFAALGGAAVFAVGDQGALVGFGAGSAAGFFYLVLLQRTVDAMGNPTAGLTRGPPPIVAIILLMAIIGKNHDEVALFPALMGLGTYKLATIAQALVPLTTADKRLVGR
jgi:hypothetical protein